MTYTLIDAVPAGPCVGAEVSGVSIEKDLDAETVAEIRQALNEFGVIWFRGQNVSVERQVEFAGLFGEVYQHPVGNQVSHVPGVFPIYADEHSTRANGEVWHADASADSEPPMASILQLQEVPRLGGDTMFSAMTAAYDALSEPMKTFLGDLTAIHDAGHVYRKLNFEKREYVQSTHPMVCAHPETGRPVLYVNSMYTTRIVELTSAESDALLAYLYNHINTPSFHLRFHWEPHTILFWDNRTVQHQAVFDYWPQRRVGTRVQIKGSRPSQWLPRHGAGTVKEFT